MAAPDPLTYIRLTSALRKTYSEAEIEMMRKVARRLQRGISVPGWAERKLAEMTLLNREILSALTGLNTFTSAELRQLLTQAYSTGTATALDLLHAGSVTPIEGLFTTPSPFALEALYTQTFAQVSSANLRILRSTLDFYRSVVSSATAFGVTGVFTRQEVSQRMLDQWARMGLSGFTDVAGKRWEMSTYAEMSARSGMTRSFISGRLNQFREYTNLVQVDTSPEECPLCEPWAGDVLSQDGKSPDYEPLDFAIQSGLFHPNCTHNVSPYFEDFHKALEDPEALVGQVDPDAWMEREKQRGLERQIRSWKRRDAVAVPGSPQQLLAAQKVRDWQSKTRSFVNATGRQRLYYREAIGA